MIMKEKGEASVSTEETATPAPGEPDVSVAPQGVNELSKWGGLVTSVAAAAYAGPSNAGPSTPWLAAVPYTSEDWEFAQKLFVELNREVIKISSDGALVDLVSDDEDIMEADASEAEKEVASGDKEEEGTVTDDGPLE
jgi:hypothetical protein